MPRTRAVSSRRRPATPRRRAPPPVRLSPAATARIVAAVIRAERRAAVISVTFLRPPAMRRMNREWKGHDWVTDVLAFPLPQPDGGLSGDVYVCGAVAQTEARRRRRPVRQELIRLVIHGTLHVLGYRHPEGAGRTRSAMWRRQERYVQDLA